MKLRYVIRKFVEASSVSEALRLDKTTKAHEAYVDNEWWKERGFALKEQLTKMGFEEKKNDQTRT